ncbi:MAG: thioredoxin [Planctomycetaceae bacterium]|nr:thioredoxin [Planctomycetaceae bacterium]
MSSSKNVVELTDDNFEAEILQSDVPALVDFWAEWCMPCKMLGPVIDQLADDLAGRAKIAKLDTDSAQETARRFGITAIPTLMIFKDGQVVKKFVGLQQKADLKEAIEEAM